MKCYRAGVLLEEIDKAIKDIKSFDYASPLEKSYLAKFLVVFICGIYEEIIESIVSEKIEMLHSVQASNFVTRYLEDYFRNPDFEKIVCLLNRFDENWGKELQQTEKILRDALGSIVSNKNALAHGLTCNITLDQVEEFYNNSKKIIEKIDEIVLSS